MKIYTKTGDKGKTSLLGGVRVDKDHYRIEAYGTVDELNSHLGFLISKLESFEQETEQLSQIQDDLFIIGSRLATPENSKFKPPELDVKNIEKLEKQIDRYQDVLPTLKNFILPGGSDLASLCHITRTICRRAERRVVSIAKLEKTELRYSIKYLNRLSDFLFVLARFINFKLDKKEISWTAPVSKKPTS